MASNKRRRRASSLSNDSSKENIDYSVSQIDGHEDDMVSSDRSEDERDFRRNIKLHSTQRERTFMKDSALVDSTLDQSTQRDDEEDEQADMDSTPTETFGNGTVVSVSLINFMCHERFEINFGPRVNFVVGRNGSE